MTILFYKTDAFPTIHDKFDVDAQLTIYRHKEIYTFTGVNVASIGWNKQERWCQLLTLIMNIAKALLIFPLFTSSYYQEIQRSYSTLGTHRNLVYTLAPANYPLWKKLATASKDIYKNAHKTGVAISQLNCHFCKQALPLLKKHNDAFIAKEFMGISVVAYPQHTFLQWTLKMPGVALIASYLMQKHHMTGLYVCQSIGAFQEKLAEINQSNADTRIALIIPATIYSPRFDPYPQSQHKVAVCIEKSNGHTKIAVMEPHQFKKEPSISPKNIVSALDDLQRVDPTKKAQLHINCKEFIFWHIIHSAHFDLNKTSLYLSTVPREQLLGCETFSLKDGMAFLKNPNFFNQIKAESFSEPIEWQGHQGFIQNIVALPAEFMKGTQSISAIKQYHKDLPDLAKRPLSHFKKGMQQSERTLEQCVQDHTVAIKRKAQNHYTNWRSHKYHLIALNALENLTTADLKAAIMHTLLPETDLRTLEARQKDPHTLNDLNCVKQAELYEKA